MHQGLFGADAFAHAEQRVGGNGVGLGRELEQRGVQRLLGQGHAQAGVGGLEGGIAIGRGGIGDELFHEVTPI